MAVVAIVAIIVVAFIGHGIYKAVSSAIEASSMNGDSTCADFIASSNDQLKTSNLASVPQRGVRLAVDEKLCCLIAVFAEIFHWGRV